MAKVELIDIVSPTGEKTGACKERSVAHARGLWHRTVHVWMRNAEGDLLLQRRSATKETHPGLWDISCAGHLSAGDTSREGAVREAREELGLTIDGGKLKWLFEITERWKSDDGFIVDNEIKDVYLYEIPVNKEYIHIDGEEVDSIRFLSPEEFEKQLITYKTTFVPHEEEYRRLLCCLALYPVRSN